MSDWINQIELIQNRIKQQLHARKVDDLEILYQLIVQFDKDNSGSLQKDEFEKFLGKLGVFLTTQEFRAVYNIYDTNKDGNIAYSEFIELIRTNMSEKRLAAVKHAFNFLDPYHNGVIPLDTLLKFYRADQHPRCKTRQKQVHQVQAEFENCIRKKSSDGKNLTEQEFLSYYADFNATLPVEKEEYFIETVLNTWGVQSSQEYVSPERLAGLELILYEKIRQKTNTKEDEGKAARKAFKYFDIEDKGVININQFSQALDKFGCVFKKNEIQALFNKYDTDGSGKLCFDEFCGLMATMGSGKTPNLNPVFEIQKQPPVALIKRIRDELKKRGVHGIRGAGLFFKRYDKNKNGTLERDEFTWALKESGIVLTKTESDNLFKYFDKNYDNQISYQEFLVGVRGDLYNQTRREIVQKAFQKLDKDGSGEVQLNDLVGVYDASCHKDVRGGKKTEKEILYDFLAQWDTLKKDGIVSQEEFHNYYEDVSVNFDNDEHFVTLIQKAWRL